jgi:Family of unknown function (DUF6520)
MKIIKSMLPALAFALALVLSFAFKPSAKPYGVAYTQAANCTNVVDCEGGPHVCKIGGVTLAFTDIGTCAVSAKMP